MSKDEFSKEAQSIHDGVSTVCLALYCLKHRMDTRGIEHVRSYINDMVSLMAKCPYFADQMKELESLKGESLEVNSAIVLNGMKTLLEQFAKWQAEGKGSKKVEHRFNPN